MLQIFNTTRKALIKMAKEFIGFTGGSTERERGINRAIMAINFCKEELTVEKVNELITDDGTQTPLTEEEAEKFGIPNPAAE